MKKFLSCLILVALMATTLTCNAFALTPVSTDESTAPLPTPEEFNVSDDITGITGMPVSDGSHRVRDWLSEQIRFEVVFTNAFDDGEKYISLRLSDATKIIFLVDQQCPTYYDGDGNLWQTDFDIPCGIRGQWYRYLECVSRMSALYGGDGVDQMMADYTAEELAEYYAELREAAMPYYGELIEWLDNYSIDIAMPAFTLSHPKTFQPIEPPAPAPVPADDYEVPTDFWAD